MDTDRQNNGFNSYIKRLVEYKAQGLVGKAGYMRGDVEDIKQEMFLDLLKRMRKFDPAKASLSTFADRVVSRKACDLLRHRQADMRDWRREAFSLDEEVESEEGVTLRHDVIGRDEAGCRKGGHYRHGEEVPSVKMDVAEALAGLPSELRRAAELLMRMSVSEAAREMGIPRGTFRDRYLGPLREAMRGCISG